MVVVSNRWLGTTWKMSPALMYSRARSTHAMYCSREVRRKGGGVTASLMIVTVDGAGLCSALVMSSSRRSAFSAESPGSTFAISSTLPS